jgi:hypothetical protein
MANSPIDQAKLRQDVLSDGKEDYTGLYEIVWSLNTQYPDVSRDLKVAAARAIVTGLLREGQVALYRTVWASNRYEPVPQKDALGALGASAAWEDPSDQPYLCYAAA